MTKRWLGPAAGLCVALLSVRAGAENMKAQCVQANTNAQSLRRDGKLAEAREQLRFCSETKCPALVISDCIKRLDELENAQPTVIFDVVDAAGKELNDVRVSLDGHLLLEKLEGTAVNVDPGEHTLTFAAPDRPSVKQQVVFREGEKSRHLRVSLPSGKETASAATAIANGSEGTPAQSASTPPQSTGPSNAGRTAGYVVGGAGIAGLAVGGVFGYLAIGAKQRQIDNCESATTCANYQSASAAHRDATTDGTISTVAFIVGGAATAAGLVLILTAKHTDEPASTLALVPSVGPGNAGVSLTGTF